MGRPALSRTGTSCLLLNLRGKPTMQIMKHGKRGMSEGKIISHKGGIEFRVKMRWTLCGVGAGGTIQR